VSGNGSASGSTGAIVAVRMANAGIRGGEVRRVPHHPQFVDARRSRATRWRTRRTRPCCCSASGAPDARRPSGTSSATAGSRFFYSFVVALVLFSLGAIFALYEGYHKIVDPHPLTSPMVAVGILVVAIALESYSFRTAVESKPLKGKGTWWQFIRRSRNPELPVVLLEGTGALLGLVFALLGVGLTGASTGNPRGTASALRSIGALLGVIAVILMIEMHSLLIGESATGEELAAIQNALVGTEHVDRVIHLRTQVPRPRGDARRSQDRVGAEHRPGCTVARGDRPGRGGRAVSRCRRRT